MFTDNTSLGKTIGHDKNKKILELRDLVMHLFTTHAEMIVAPSEMYGFELYINGVFNYIFDKYAIDKDELCIDMDTIMSHTYLGKDKQVSFNTNTLPIVIHTTNTKTYYVQ